MDAKSRYFLSSDLTKSSPVLYREYSTPILSEIVHVTLKSVAVVISGLLNLSAIFVINHSCLNTKVSLE